MRTKAQARLRKMPYHCERLWALVRARGDRTEMCYRLGRSAAEVYMSICEEESLGTGWTPERLRDEGWTAVRVHVEELGARK
jgi:hypothetical protein